MARMEDAMTYLRQRLQATVAVDTLVYHRGNDSVTLLKKCWVGRTAFRIEDKNGSRLIWSDRDFLIPVIDLVLSGQEVTPQEGDWIEQIFDGPEGNQAFEMMSPNTEPKWRYSDPQRTIYRIHCKRVLHS